MIGQWLHAAFSFRSLLRLLILGLLRLLLMTSCISDVTEWMNSNRLQLNAATPEFMWSVSSRQQRQIPTNSLVLGSTSMKPVMRPRPGSLHRLGHVTWRRRCLRLCLAASVHYDRSQKHSTISEQTSYSVTCNVAGVDMSELRECYHRCCIWSTSRLTTVSECSTQPRWCDSPSTTTLTASRRRTCRRLLPMLPTCRLDVDQLLVPSYRGGQRSVGGRSPSLALVSGTVFPLTLRLLRRWSSSGVSWRQNFFAAATMLLDCWPSFLLLIVVLELDFLSRPL